MPAPVVIKCDKCPRIVLSDEPDLWYWAIDQGHNHRVRVRCPEHITEYFVREIPGWGRTFAGRRRFIEAKKNIKPIDPLAPTVISNQRKK